MRSATEVPLKRVQIARENGNEYTKHKITAINKRKQRQKSVAG